MLYVPRLAYAMRLNPVDTTHPHVNFALSSIILLSAEKSSLKIVIVGWTFCMERISCQLTTMLASLSLSQVSFRVDGLAYSAQRLS